MIKINVNNFNLKDTVTCGQIFRFHQEEDDSYTIVIHDRVINVKQDNEILIVKSDNENMLENIVKEYFDLNRDYNKINEQLLLKNKNIKDIIEKCSGLKMIKQDRFETIIAYIISQNNRVSMIATCLNNISEKYGKKITFEGIDYYLFPTLEELSNASKEDLRTLKVGFRDEYIVGVIKNINDGLLDIDEIGSMDSSLALEKLMENKGIGEKVASCILLFAYQRFDVFPIDTWVKKYMLDNYNIKDKKKIKEYAIDNYGEYCGIAIQYMFHSKRNK